MTAKKKNNPATQIDMALAEDLAENIADVLNNTVHHYWLSPADAQTATIDCYKQIVKAFDSTDRIAFRIFDGALLINGNALKQKSRNITIFVEHLQKLQIDNFTLFTGLTQKDFVNFLEIIEAQPVELEQLGGFAACIERFKLENIESKKLIFQEITEDEIVVSKDEHTENSGSADEAGSSASNILAFLKGDISADNKDALKDVQETAADASKMAELIMKATEIRQQEASLEGGESMVDFVVGCLRRTYAGLTQEKAAKTKTGKKRITRNLLLLEKEILDRMRSMSMEWDDDDLQTIMDATQEITDELKIDSLADEYITKREATEETEQQILEYIRNIGIESLDKLKKKLSDKGMDIGDWQELVIKSQKDTGNIGPGAGTGPGAGNMAADGETGMGAGDGNAPGAGPGMGDGPGGTAFGGSLGLGIGSGFALGSLIEAIGHLDVVLGNMEKDFDDTNQQARQSNSNELVTVLSDVTVQVKNLSTGTDERIQNLIDNIQADADIIDAAESKAIQDGQHLNTTRKDIIKTLVTIIREIIEPLEVIRASMHMIQSKTMGGLNRDQENALRLASENIDIISALLQKLETISRQN